MKKLIATPLFVLLTITTVFSQITATLCLKKAEKADFVFEGKVIGYETENIENSSPPLVPYI